MAKLANGTKAATLLPEVADGLIAHRCLTVSEGAAVSLHNTWNTVSLQVTRHFQQNTQCVNTWFLCLKFSYFSAGGIVKEVAVISMVVHSNAWVTEGMKLEPLNPAAGSLQGQQDSPWNKDHSSTWEREKPYFFKSQPIVRIAKPKSPLVFKFFIQIWMSWSNQDCCN